MQLQCGERAFFFTGGAGTGKSFLLQQLLRVLDTSRTAVTASTALAASHLGGTTLHKWAGVGRAEADVVALAEELRKKTDAVRRWKRTKTLVIDEVSMVDGTLFEKLDVLARATRRSDTAFGGMQLVLAGDFLQLPPVCRKGRDLSPCFTFQVPAWKAIKRTFELTEIFRQKDRSFCEVLNEIRFGSLSEKAVELLRPRLVRGGLVHGRDGKEVTRLMPLRSEVEEINRREARCLAGEAVRFDARDQGDSLQLDAASGAPPILELKVGSLVVLTRTIDISRKLVNGSQGRVTGFTGSGALKRPIIRFAGAEITLDLVPFDVRSGTRVAVREQLPLDFGWAMSVHKSQGLSLSGVEVNLENIFEHGQTYVALSRAQTLDGLHLIGSEESLRRSVHADAHCVAFHRGISHGARQVPRTPSKIARVPDFADKENWSAVANSPAVFGGA